MSTFKGVLAEFPQIRIDYFRQQPDQKAPLACFLSHVHSDHLAGLESLRAPFVYCSAATREILLRLEKYHYRVNFARGILESRNVTYDRSMRKLAKPLPLDTPTTLELSPANSIRVTLIDANHCVGAVMFLIEGDGKAVLYTGDIRAETWWVNSLVQNPVLLPYTLDFRSLDCIYLDTTFATKSKPYRDFPSKADGIRELLEKVNGCSDDTIFYFHAWTFGYENVWIALSAFLGSQIHLDTYRARLYGSLSTLDKRQLKEVGLNVSSENKFLRESGLEVREAPALCGFRNGNHIQPGCLTSRESVQIHSCEREMGCRVVDQDTEAKIVHIIPIITRSDGLDIAELGAGGGKGDLDQKEELETVDIVSIGRLMELCAKSIKDGELLTKVLALLQQGLTEKTGRLNLDMHLQNTKDEDEDNLSLQSLISALSSNVTKEKAEVSPRNKTIRFPYSRHSSYTELCELVELFKPRDVFPCTVDEDNWTPERSMQSLFGDYCSATIFRHDIEMTRLYESKIQQQRNKREREESQQDTQTTDEPLLSSQIDAEHIANAEINVLQPIQIIPDKQQVTVLPAFLDGTKDHPIDLDDTLSPQLSPVPNNTRVSVLPAALSRTSSRLSAVSHITSLAPTSSTTPTLIASPSMSHHANKRQKKISNRQIAYEAALGAQLNWYDYGGLESTRRKADRDEEEL